MNIAPLLQSYELLVDRADRAFQKMNTDYEEYILCTRHCSDCCHAVFGLFLIEAAYIQQHFEQLDEAIKRAALARCHQADQDLKRIEEKLQAYKDDPHMQAHTLASKRIRCPLLDDHQNCVLYPFRPITCRVYGIPTAIQGKARVCKKAGFKSGQTYPTFDLDGVYRDLFALSIEFLKGAGSDDPEKASFLISVSRVLRSSLQDIQNLDLSKK